MANDQSTGVASPLAWGVSGFAAQRWAQTQQALLYGPTRVIGQRAPIAITKGLFSWRAAEDEMVKFRAGGTLGQAALSRIPLGGGSVAKHFGAWGNSPLALSKWSTAAQLMHSPTRYSRQAGAAFLSDGWIPNRGSSPMGPWPAAETIVNRADDAAFLGTTKKAVRDLETGGHLRGPIAGVTDNLDGPADAAFARAWTSHSLKFGPEYVTQMSKLGKYPSRMMNFSTGMMFKNGASAGAPLSDDILGGAYKYAGKSRTLNFMSKTMESGRVTRALGEGAGYTLSKFGTAAAGISKLGGLAAGIYGSFTTAAMIGTAAYKTGELVMYKVPKKGYADIYNMLSRPAFAGNGQSWIGGPSATSNRQRAVQAIQGSKMNARSALGNEASLLAGHFG